MTQSPAPLVSKIPVQPLSTKEPYLSERHQSRFEPGNAVFDSERRHLLTDGQNGRMNIFVRMGQRYPLCHGNVAKTLRDAAPDVLLHDHYRRSSPRHGRSACLPARPALGLLPAGALRPILLPFAFPPFGIQPSSPRLRRRCCRSGRCFGILHLRPPRCLLCLSLGFQLSRSQLWRVCWSRGRWVCWHWCVLVPSLRIWAPDRSCSCLRSHCLRMRYHLSSAIAPTILRLLTGLRDWYEICFRCAIHKLRFISLDNEKRQLDCNLS